MGRDWNAYLLRGRGRYWGDRTHPRQYLQGKEVRKAVYNVMRDKKSATRPAHVLGGIGLVPLLPFPSEQSQSTAWCGHTTSQVPGDLLTPLFAAVQLCSEKRQWYSYYWDQEFHFWPRQRSLCTVVRKLPSIWNRDEERRIQEKKKSLRRNSEACLLIWKRKHFQQENRHCLLLFIHSENKAWYSRKKMSFVIQMTCALNQALTLPVNGRDNSHQNIPCVAHYFQISLQLGLELVMGSGQRTVNGLGGYHLQADIEAVVPAGIASEGTKGTGPHQTLQKREINLYIAKPLRLGDVFPTVASHSPIHEYRNIPCNTWSH